MGNPPVPTQIHQKMQRNNKWMTQLMCLTLRIYATTYIKVKKKVDWHDPLQQPVESPTLWLVHDHDIAANYSENRCKHAILGGGAGSHVGCREHVSVGNCPGTFYLSLTVCSEQGLLNSYLLRPVLQPLCFKQYRWDILFSLHQQFDNIFYATSIYIRYCDECWGAILGREIFRSTKIKSCQALRLSMAWLCQSRHE